MPADFTANQNVYARPVADTDTIFTVVSSTNISRALDVTFMGTASWRTWSGQDALSTRSPVAVASMSDLQFEFNASSTPRTVTLARTFVDPRGLPLSGTLTLAPWSSRVLLYKP